MECSLALLPPELLAHIVSYFETARTLLHFSLTCKRLHNFIDKDGFRIFVQNRFPSIQIPSFWKDAAHAMTTLSRNWDRRAFVAQFIFPSPGLARIHPHLPGTQTIGYHPVIDSYEEWIGDTWSSRRQILAWAAGCSLILRSKRIGGNRDQALRRASSQVKKENISDQHSHECTWTVFKDSQFIQGRDDITSVNLLRSKQKLKDDLEYVAVGRANGILNLISLSTTDFRKVMLTEFETKNRPVRSATISEPVDPLLAVCLSDSSLALYHVETNSDYTKPCDEIVAVASGRPAKTWSARFLRHNRLAVGFGPSKEPIRVYDIRPDGFSKDPIHNISIKKAGQEISENEDANGVLTSVYSINPLAPSSSAGGAEGDIFLSGGYDGSVRLHDLRSPEKCIAVFSDPVDTFSPIYSLASFGRERFIAGGARYALLKIFDLRMPGGKLYHATDLDPCPSRSNRCQPDYFSHAKRKLGYCQYHDDARHHRPDTNVFMNDFQADHRYSRRPDSPIYSLSSPSSCSPTFFVGLEERVLQIDVVSIMDRHPDPIYRYGPKPTQNRDFDLRMKWNPHSNVLCLTSYEQRRGNIDLVVQQRVRAMTQYKMGIDERWRPRHGSMARWLN